VRRLRGRRAFFKERPMPDPIARWHAEHADFNRLLDLLEAQLSALQAEDQTPDYDLMRDIVSYLTSYADRAHHPREDVAFARLGQRDPALQLPINRLLQEHRVIRAAGKELLERLEQVAADVIIPREALETAAATYLVYYRHHVSREEREVLPRAKELLTRADWAALTAVSVAPDPLFGDNPEARFRELRKHWKVPPCPASS
jgi:hemerythrin-like domain-containing protein